MAAADAALQLFIGLVDPAGAIAPTGVVRAAAVGILQRLQAAGGAAWRTQAFADAEVRARVLRTAAAILDGTPTRSPETYTALNPLMVESVLLVVEIMVESAPEAVEALLHAGVHDGHFIARCALPRVLDILFDPASDIGHYSAQHLLKVIRAAARHAPTQVLLVTDVTDFVARCLSMFSAPVEDAIVAEARPVMAILALESDEATAVRFLRSLITAAREACFTAAGATGIVDAMVNVLAHPSPTGAVRRHALEAVRAAAALADTHLEEAPLQKLLFWALGNATGMIAAPGVQAVRTALAAEAPLWVQLCRRAAAALRGPMGASDEDLVCKVCLALTVNCANNRGLGYLAALCAVEQGVLAAAAAALPTAGRGSAASRLALLDLLDKLCASVHAVRRLPPELPAGLLALLATYGGGEGGAAGPPPPEGVLLGVGAVLGKFMRLPMHADALAPVQEALDGFVLGGGGGGGNGGIGQVGGAVVPAAA